MFMLPVNSLFTQCADISATGDCDGDLVLNGDDLDDDNDGILDADECPQPISSGLSGAITTFTHHITSNDPADHDEPHVLDSITYDGTTYTDFIVPDAFESSYSLTNNSSVRFTENGTATVFNYNSATYDADVIQAFADRNLNAYQALDGNDFSNGDYYDLTYNTPILSTAGGFIAITERGGNNPQIIDALDVDGNVIGTTLNITTGNYVDLGYNVHPTSTQNVNMALFPLEDLAIVGTKIYGLRTSFGPTATSDGPDSKVFIFGDAALIICDDDNDGIDNQYDVDSDNDGCVDALEGNGGFDISNVNTTGGLTGGVDSDGVPILAGDGQISISAGDSTILGSACTDWGDLPDISATTGTSDYQTTMANGGPVHVIIPGLTLGLTVDGEGDGQASSDALGDNGDEDGTQVYPTLNIRPNIVVRFPLNVVNLTGNIAHVEAWVDWNGDGAFDGAGEMVTDYVDAADGVFPDHIVLNVPANAIKDTPIGLRIRLSNSDNMTPYGQINSGEVEDYLITITCSPKSSTPVELNVIENCT